MKITTRQFEYDYKGRSHIIVTLDDGSQWKRSIDDPSTWAKLSPTDDELIKELTALVPSAQSIWIPDTSVLESKDGNGQTGEAGGGDSSQQTPPDTQA